MHNSGLGGVSSSRASKASGWCCSARDGGTAVGMAAQGRRWRNRHAPLAYHHGAVLRGCRVDVRTSFEGSTVLFRGVRHGGRTGVDSTVSWSWHRPSRTVPGMAAQGGLAEQRRDMIPRRCQRAGVTGIRLWPRRPGHARAFNALVDGVGVTSRARGGLERGGESPEGASGPRARWRIAWGGVRPSSEVENHPRGRQALERGGVCTAWRPVLELGGNSPEGYRGRLVGGPLWFLWAVGLSTLGCDHTERVFGVRGVFVCVLLFFEKGVFPGY
jgi:hypothetical protein